MYGIDGDRGEGRERGGDVEGDEEKVHNIFTKEGHEMPRITL